MTDHHFFEHEQLERWWEDHDALCVVPLFVLMFVIFGFSLYSMFAHNDASLLQSIPLASAEW